MLKPESSFRDDQFACGQIQLQNERPVYFHCATSARRVALTHRTSGTGGIVQRVISIPAPPVAQRREQARFAASMIRTALSRLVVCWHRRLSWPITRESKTYRTCLRCGMCRRFDPQTWKSFGPFYREMIKRERVNGCELTGAAMHTGAEKALLLEQEERSTGNQLSRMGRSASEGRLRPIMQILGKEPDHE